MINQSATIAAEEILAAHVGALSYCRQAFGGQVDARSIDLRLWTAAAIIKSCKDISRPDEIMRSLETKLEFLEQLPGGGS